LALLFSLWNPNAVGCRYQPLAGPGDLPADDYSVAGEESGRGK
jgi:hypothetical protein